MNSVEEEREDVEIMVEGEESHEVSYDEVRHDQKVRKFDNTRFRIKIYVKFSKHKR